MSAARSDNTDLSLNEMLHVLDVARTLRRDQQIAESELNQAELRRGLRERLLAGAREAGDNVTPAEVDTAIQIYFENLHRYSDPPLSLTVALAHLYVRRRLVAASTLFIAAALGLCWWLYWSPGARFSPEVRRQLQELRQQSALTDAWQGFERQAQSARAVAEDPAAITALDRLQREAEAARQTADVAALQRVQSQAAHLEEKLREEYEVLIVSAPGRLSGVERDFDGRASGSYLIVEARTPDGRVLSRPITSRELGTTRTVAEWGEQVPPAVLSRIEADKRADGVVDERLFAVKHRGRLEEEVRLAGEDGQPLTRQGQITEW